jgi:hypothetical protein
MWWGDPVLGRLCHLPISRIEIGIAFSRQNFRYSISAFRGLLGVRDGVFVFTRLQNVVDNQPEIGYPIGVAWK